MSLFWQLLYSAPVCQGRSDYFIGAAKVAPFLIGGAARGWFGRKKRDQAAVPR
ncbi:MAG: hypothetical protein ACR2FY_26000 [Pirellulaceae bacterium]